MIMNQSKAIKQEILNRKNDEVLSHIQSFFDIGGVEMPCELIKDLTTEYTEYAKNHPRAVFDYDVVTTNVYYSMELMSFISILYQKLTEVKQAKNALKSS